MMVMMLPTIARIRMNDVMNDIPSLSVTICIVSSTRRDNAANTMRQMYEDAMIKRIRFMISYLPQL